MDWALLWRIVNQNPQTALISIVILQNLMQQANISKLYRLIDNRTDYDVKQITWRRFIPGLRA